MTCQISGRGPTVIIGLGRSDWPSRIRMPYPPQNSTTFMTRPRGAGSYGSSDGRDRMARPSRNDLQAWNGENQPAAPLAHVGQLGDELVAQVPGQDQHVVGFVLGDLLGRQDRDAGARGEPAVLVGVAVDGVSKQVGPDPAVVEQRVALARG